MQGDHAGLRPASSVLNAEQAGSIAELAFRHLRAAPQRVAMPGGKSRSAFFVDTGTGHYVFTKRDEVAEAVLEANVLSAMAPTGLVPNLIAQEDEWTIQQLVPGVRLPLVLHDCETMAEREVLVAKALDALLAIRAHADGAGLQDKLPVIGKKRAWFEQLAAVPSRFSQKIGVTGPVLNRKAIARELAGNRDSFIKYDARPGNALIDGENVCWFDWEDCGFGNPVEDLAFMLCDEWMAIDHTTLIALRDRYLPLFANGQDASKARRHFTLYGALHAADRLKMCLQYNHRDGGWWDRAYCLQHDKVGNTEEETARLCVLINLLAADDALLQPLVPWTDTIRNHFHIPGSGEKLNDRRVA